MVDEALAGLRRLWTGYMPARVIITANNMGVFDRLVRPKTARALARELKANPRGAQILLDALAGIGVVSKNGVRYRNSPAADRYLVSGKPLYQGDIIRHNHNMWQRWSALDEVVRTGKPAPRVSFDHGAFIMGMHNLSVLRAREVLAKTGLRGIRSALDLGGGPGTYAIEMAKRGISATIFDMPETIKIARRLARKQGAKGIRYICGDFRTDDIGEGYDLILISQIFHAYGEGENIALLKKCKKAMASGGRVAVQEFPLEESRTAPPPSALFAVNMLVGTDEGRTYTPGEMSGWLKRAGFRGIGVINLSETVLIVAGA